MDGTSLLAWHHLELDIPNTWEVIRFSKKTDDGQIVLSDRFGETMHIFWKKIKEAPSIERRITELVEANSPDKEAPPDIRSKIKEISKWQVYFHSNKKFPVFAGRYLEDKKILLNITLPPHKKHDPRKAIEPILASYSPNDKEEKCWAMSGINVTLPTEYFIEGVELLPACQRMSFETKKEFRLVVYRYGMMSRHLANQTLESFMAKVTDRKGSLLLKDQFEKDGRYPGVELTYYTKGTGSILMNLIARKWHGHIFAWQSKERERIYAIENHCKKGKEISDLKDRLKTI